LLSELVVVGGFERDAAARGIGELLKRGVVFDAVMACNDLMALGALEACLAQGRRVPEDIALIGFDDTPDGRFAEVPLSTVRQSIHGLGYAGVKLLLDRIHGRSAAQHVVLPTELVLRRSFDPAHEDPPDSVTTGPDLATTLARRRPALLERLARVTTQAGSLIDLFADALTRRSPAELMRGACALASRDHEIGEDTGGWHPALTTLERESAAYIAGHPELAVFNREFWLQLRVMLAEIGERFRARCLIAKQRELAVLRRIGEGLLTTLDTEHIMELLASEFSNLKLESCHIVLFDRGRLSDEADIVLVWDARTRRVDLSRKRIASRCLVPGTPRFADHASNLIVEPLYFEQEQLGFAVFEMGPADGTVYETLREQTSSAIKRARLVAQLLQQTKLRERAEQGQLHKEVEIAMKLQTSILPREMRVDGLDLAGQMSPVSEVGGDYYDVIAVPGGCWIGIGDVTGHGLQAGLVMLMLQSMLGALVHSVEPSPHTVVSAMNVALCRNIRERLGRKEHATLTILRYERNGRVRLAGAHEEILIYRSATGSVELVSTPGTWVGIDPNIEFEECEFQLGDGDVMLLYTDGVIEARSPANVLFGMDRLCQLIVDVGREPAQVICDRVLAAVLAWAPVPQDDVTVLVARHLASDSVTRLS
jgi:serine phosphatase RsbU (regulator of sigma subunit)